MQPIMHMLGLKLSNMTMQSGMRKLLILLFSILLTVTSKGQSGSGTVGDPYYGTIAGTPTWNPMNFTNGEVYVGSATLGEDLTINGGHLTILPGIKVIFMRPGSDLIINNLGRLTADGTPANKITFTRYFPTYNYWGHISFEAMGAAGASLFDNCIIEYGDVSSFSNGDPHGGGGGMFIDFNNVLISNSVFQHNKAQWGGGIFVFTSRYPTITNCTFYDNFAKEAGGGIFLWNYASSIIENCIFYSNSCQGTSASFYTGGGLAAQSSCSIKLVNCTFTNNISSRSEGQGLMLYSSSASRVINSIFWGSGNQIYLASGTSGNTIINSAIQTAVPSGSVNCIALNSSNTAPDGPNFIATDGTNWLIKFISPCRDAGINSYTGVTIPALDYAGNSRVGIADIGAYEVQYTGWKITASSTDWNSAANWDGGVPTGSTDVVVPTGAANYPIGLPSQDFTVGAGKMFIIEQGARVTLNDFVNNGTLRLNSTAAGFASFILNSYTRGTGGTEEIQIYLTGGGNADDDNFQWHYISTPVSSIPVSTFAPGTTLDVAQYVESRPSLSLAQGWVAYDGYIYSTSATTGPTFATLTPGKGYNYWDNANNTFTFSGRLNTSNVSVPITYAGIPALHGFNLLGNPFSSGLNWDDIINGVYFAYPANTSKSIYFTRDNVECSYIAGVGIPGDVTGIIPPMQGFFTKTYTSGNTITLPAAARTNGNIHPRYKGSNIIPLVRLNLKSDSTHSDETVVRFDELAKSILDNDFDAMKMFISATRTQIYSKGGTTNFAINGLPFPDTFVEIPLTISLTKDTIYSLSATQLQGLDYYYVILKDLTTGVETNLKTSPNISFAGTTGTSNDRFVLKVGVMSNQAISFITLPVKTYGDADFSLAASSGSGLDVSYTSGNSLVATILNGTVHLTGAGTSVITVSQPGSIIYFPAVAVSQTLTVNKADQTIEFGALPVKIVGDENFTPTATASSSLAVNLSSNNSAVATVVDGIVHITGAGIAVIIASQQGDANYKSAADVSQTLTVNTVTGIEVPVSSENSFNIYSVNKIVNIVTESDAWEGKKGSVKVLDMTGRTIKDLRNIEFNKDSRIQIPVSPEGIYIVEIKSEAGSVVRKVVVR